MPSQETDATIKFYENFNNRFDDVIKTMNRLELSISTANSNTTRQMDAINIMQKEISEIRGTHGNKGCMPLQNAINVRGEHINNIKSEIDKISKSLEKIDTDMDSLKIKIALWSGGISVGVWMISFLFKGLWK